MKKIMPPTYFLIALLLAVSLHLIWPMVKIIKFPYNWSGVILIIVGGWLAIWADNIFKKRKTAVKPYEESSVLVREGPFCFSRHPMYLGMVISLLGIAITLGSLVSFIAPLAFYLAMQFIFISIEEKMMEEKFGERYRDYKKRTRKWL